MADAILSYWTTIASKGKIGGTLEFQKVMVMPKKDGIRAAIAGQFGDRLTALGRLLGHSSQSQTIEYLLDLYLDKEIKAAEDFRKSRLSS